LLPTHSLRSRSSQFLCLLITIIPPTTSTPFPYTTLFRSHCHRRAHMRGRPERQHALQLRFDQSRDDGDPQTRQRIGVEALREPRSEEHTSELQSRFDLVCRLLLEKKKYTKQNPLH